MPLVQFAIFFDNVELEERGCGPKTFWMPCLNFPFKRILHQHSYHSQFQSECFPLKRLVVSFSFVFLSPDCGKIELWRLWTAILSTGIQTLWTSHKKTDFFGGGWSTLIASVPHAPPVVSPTCSQSSGSLFFHTHCEGLHVGLGTTSFKGWRHPFGIWTLLN